MAELLKPKPYTTVDMDGVPLTVILSRFPATVGREILCNYPLTALPKIGDYPSNEALMQKLMGYVAVDNNGTELRLTTRALIDNQTRDAETCMKIEHAMLEYNSSFFQSGKLSNFFDECLKMFMGKIFEMSTQSSQPSPPPVSPLSTNSEKSTT